jgi:prolyl-tRNA synthetase
VEGFAKECAVITHHRLEADPGGGLRPAAPLEEPLVVRPTSETIIGALFAKWVQSYRDLPLLINQWANIVRWEMRTRLFLRTTEFLWQEGHTVHATEAEAREETRRILDLYTDFAENWMAMPVLKGEKTAAQRFPGAVTTYCIEAMMQDRKALQAGTSHFLGQNFARAFDITFQDADEKEVHAWTTSWGVSTRLIGGLVMTHADDDGLVLPPRLAPAHVVILPVIHEEGSRASVLEACARLAEELRGVEYDGQSVRVELDERDMRGGEKVWSWIKKGVPVRLEVGPRDIASDSVFVGRRDRPHRDRASVPRAAFVAGLPDLLAEIQQGLFERALALRDEHTQRLDTREELYAYFTPANPEKPEIHGGFAACHWGGDAADEDALQKELNVTVRVIPLDAQPEQGSCIFTGKPSTRRVILGKAY